MFPSFFQLWNKSKKFREFGMPFHSDRLMNASLLGEVLAHSVHSHYITLATVPLRKFAARHFHFRPFHHVILALFLEMCGLWAFKSDPKIIIYHILVSFWWFLSTFPLKTWKTYSRFCIAHETKVKDLLLP